MHSDVSISLILLGPFLLVSHLDNTLVIPSSFSLRLWNQTPWSLLSICCLTMDLIFSSVKWGQRLYLLHQISSRLIYLVYVKQFESCLAYGKHYIHSKHCIQLYCYYFTISNCMSLLNFFYKLSNFTTVIAC